MSTKFLVLGGGILGFVGGGADFIFMGARSFLKKGVVRESLFWSFRRQRPRGHESKQG